MNAKPIKITLARKKTELRQIIALQRENLAANVDEATARDQGFVTAIHTYPVLEAMNTAAASVIAKDGTRVVGYALTMKQEFANAVPALTDLFARQDAALLRNLDRFPELTADALNYLVMGQVCVAAAYRGRKLVDRMYRYMRSCYSLHYPYLITAIDARNTRSRRVHERIGFRELDRFVQADGKDWILVVWRWRE